jgi:hypothetical protein
VALGLVLALAGGASALQAQQLVVGDIDELWLRTLQVAGRVPLGPSLLVRPVSIRSLQDSASQAAAQPWQGRWLRSFGPDRSFGLTPARARLIYNSHFPESRNEGAVVPARNLTQVFDVGAWARLGPLEFTLRPTLAWVQNAYFRVAGWEREGDAAYRHPWRSMDLPQRFGPDPYWVVDPGQSEVRLEVGGVAASFGTANRWWGPGLRNALLMSNNAAGFPHLSIASSRPLDLGFARFEGQWLFGHLQSSGYFAMPGDPPAADPGRYVTGAAFSISPTVWGLDGLSVGAARVFYALVPEDGISAGDYLLVLQTPIKNDLVSESSPTGDDQRDQLVSIFGRWVFPESGFELYAEWGRNDHGEDLRDYFLHVEHSQAYLLGLQKTFEPDPATIVTLHAELTHLQGPADQGVRGVGTWYDHGLVPHGYTQRGQVIGAAAGPGSNAQYLGVHLQRPWGRAGAWLQRTVNDRDAYRNRAAGDPENWGYWRIDAMRTIGLDLRLFAGNWDAVVEGSYTRNFNRHFNYLSDHSNYRLEVSARRRWGR